MPPLSFGHFPRERGKPEPYRLRAAGTWQGCPRSRGKCPKDKGGSSPSFLTISDFVAYCVEYGVYVLEDVGIPKTYDAITSFCQLQTPRLVCIAVFVVLRTI